MVTREKSEKSIDGQSKFVLLTFIAFFIALPLFAAAASHWGYSLEKTDEKKPDTIVDFKKESVLKKPYGEVWFHLSEPLTIHRNLTLDEKGYIYVWNPWKDLKAPEKGWLTLENPFYRIDVNLDHSYYLLYDKTADRDILVYDDEIMDPISILTGSDIGFSDHGGDKPDFFATTALHDLNGIGRHSILWEDGEKGFLLVGLEGWDYQPGDSIRGYDVEAEVLLGLFTDKPYFIDATEVNNLQKIGLVPENPDKDPDEVVRSWVLDGKFDSAVIRGGDMDHLNAEFWSPWYVVKTINGQGRKPWHFGSAQFSKMFPTHKLIGEKTDGGILFSLPEGKFRFDESLGAYGDQLVGEFLLVVDKPQKAVAFSAEPINEYEYFYDVESYREEYRESMLHICEKYGLTCPDQPLDWHNWESKRFAYVITMVDDWYDSESNTPYPEVWNQADQGLEDFKAHENVIFEQMKRTKPLTLTG